MTRIKFVVGSLAMPAVIGSIYFSSAGTLALPIVWGVLGVMTLFTVAVSLFTDRGMIEERLAPGTGNKDRITRPVSSVLLLTHWVLSGLDVGRFHWTVIDWNVQFAGLIGYAIGMSFLFWAMRSNPFYSCEVRIQSDRGQHAVAIGPYRFVRHPGYTATMLGGMCGSLALGSWIGFIPIVFLAVLFVRRTLLEDRLLRRELPGYADYANRVQYRLIAGVF